ncbi:hypothetical protein MTR67_023741 [Solanum verrucosum]|uniref:Uncharacterized protein n=1 Tax=Solanum verrucosum TaxID=315347 RepID=A0AAF0R1N2_SOLVR|nr:hypothetical protein MTR67_023741 [Solanum verrucosum]
MVADMRSRMSLFVVRLSCLSNKESKEAMLIGDVGIARLMIYVQQVEKDQLKDREEFENKRAKTLVNESEQQKELDLHIRKAVRHKRGTKTPACATCGRSNLGMCRDHSTSCFQVWPERSFYEKVS